MQADKSGYQLELTDDYATYTDADTWYPSWASDGLLYSPFTDGTAGEIGISSQFPFAQSGQARIEGDDPLNLSVTPISAVARPISARMQEVGTGVAGNYPCGSLVYDGLWSYGTYYVENYTAADGLYVTYELGAFAGFRFSPDLGATWYDSPFDDTHGLFPEVGRAAGGSPIRFGAPKFVDFGRDMEHSPDGRAYLVGHGTSHPAGIANWCAGDEVVLARVKPSIATLNDPSAYEFFAGLDQRGTPQWSPDFDSLAPILRVPGGAGLPAMTYNAGLGKYMLCTCRGPADGGGGPYGTSIWLGDEIYGPWRPVASYDPFGTEAYFVNIPSKFLDHSGRAGWLLWSANWFNKMIPSEAVAESPAGSRYGLCLRKWTLRKRP